MILDFDYFSRMRSEGFAFIVGDLGIGVVFAWLASAVVVYRRRCVSNSLPLGKVFASDFA